MDDPRISVTQFLLEHPGTCYGVGVTHEATLRYMLSELQSALARLVGNAELNESGDTLTFVWGGVTKTVKGICRYKDRGRLWHGFLIDTQSFADEDYFSHIIAPMPKNTPILLLTGLLSGLALDEYNMAAMKESCDERWVSQRREERWAPQRMDVVVDVTHKLAATSI